MTAPAIDRLLPYGCQLVRRAPGAGRDEYGNPVADETVEQLRCELQPYGSRDELGGAVQVSTWQVFLPATAPPRGWDAVQVLDGPHPGLYELEGDAAVRAPALTGLPHHVEAVVRRVE